MYHVLLIDDQPDMHKLIGHHLQTQLEGEVMLEVASNER